MPDICHELLISSSSETVYQAITSESGLSAWWTPHTELKTSEDQVLHFPFGTGYYKEMKILDAQPYRLLKWTCIAGADEWLNTTITFNIQTVNIASLLRSYPEINGQMQQLNGTDTATILRFEHANWKSYTPMYAECNYTWGQFLRSLKAFCETGKGYPWPNQHRSQV